MSATAAPSEAPHGRALRLDIQGLRAVAVLSVVLYHANEQIVPGGYVGVDIFFVISGYLIAGILLGEMDRGKFSLLGFYERRVRRLFPALFTMLAVTLAVGAFVLAPNAFEELGRTTLSTIFFVSNFDFFSMSGYFDSDARFRPLLHTWSLAVEEQFYLVFPIFLFVLTRFVRKRLRLVLALSALVSLALSVWALKHNPPGAFFLAPFRGYELLMGAMLAGLAFPARAPQIVRDIVSLVGLALIAASISLFSAATPFPGFAALVPCGGAALMLYAGAGGVSLGGRLLSSPPFVFFGALSYSLYLWHWPVLVLGKSVLLGDLTPLQTAILLLIALLAATASWRWIEQPFLKWRGDRRRVFLFAGALTAIGASAALFVMLSGGLPARFGPPAQQFFATKEDFSPERGTCHNFLWSVRPYADNCILGARGAAPHVAMWADSHGTELAAALGERLASRGESIMEITSSGCPPALDYSRADQPLCAQQNAVTLAALSQDPRIDTVIFATNFAAYPLEDHPALLAGLSRSIDAMAAAGKRIVLVYPIPVFSYDVPTALGMLAQRGEDPADYSIARDTYLSFNRQPIDVLDRARDRTGAIAFYPADILCDAARCHAFLPGSGALYFNRDHLSLTGARLVAARLPLSQSSATVRHAD